MEVSKSLVKRTTSACQLSADDVKINVDDLEKYNGSVCVSAL